MLNDTESERERMRLLNGFINKRVTFSLCFALPMINNVPRVVKHDDDVGLNSGLTNKQSMVLKKILRNKAYFGNSKHNVER